MSMKKVYTLDILSTSKIWIICFLFCLVCKRPENCSKSNVRLLKKCRILLIVFLCFQVCFTEKFTNFNGETLYNIGCHAESVHVLEILDYYLFLWVANCTWLFVQVNINRSIFFFNLVLQLEFCWESYWYYFHQSYPTMFRMLHGKRM